MSSSYNAHDVTYLDVIKSIVFTLQPRSIIEFGILNGASLSVFDAMAPEECRIEANDIFEEFNGNSAKWDDIQSKFASSKRVTVQRSNFYERWTSIENRSIDLMHIDIANDASVYASAIAHYIPKLTSNGVLLLEGGSDERDAVEWMTKYNKQPIRPYLDELRQSGAFDVHTIGRFPSITLIRPKKCPTS